MGIRFEGHPNMKRIMLWEGFEGPPVAKGLPGMMLRQAQLEGGAGAGPSTGSGQAIRTEPMTVNIGPQHPSTHGVFRLRVTFDGEEILQVEPIFGYLHRGHGEAGRGSAITRR